MADYSGEIGRWQAEVARLAPIAETVDILRRYDRDVTALAGSASELTMAQNKLAEVQKAQRDDNVLTAYSNYGMLANAVAAGNTASQPALDALVALFPHFPYIKGVLERQIDRVEPYYGDPFSLPRGVVQGTR